MHLTEEDKRIIDAAEKRFEQSRKPETPPFSERFVRRCTAEAGLEYSNPKKMDGWFARLKSILTRHG